MKLLHPKESVIDLDFKSLEGANWQHILNLRSVKDLVKDKRLVYLRLKNESNEFFPAAWPQTQYDDLKKVLRNYDENIFVVFDSVCDAKGIFSFSMLALERFVFFRVVGGRKVFWGEDVPANVEDNVIDISCVRAKVFFNGQPHDFYFPVLEGTDIDKFMKQFKNGALLKFSAMKLEKTERVDKERIKTAVYLVNSFFPYEDNYYDVAQTVSKIKSISDLYLYKDFKTFQPIYPDIINRLVLYDVLYVRVGEPVFNLVLSGSAGVGKSWIVDLYTKAFGKISGVSISASSSTSKGFVPNFGERKAQPGMLLEPQNFVKGIQEMFRGVCSETREKDKTSAIGSHLMKFMNVLERTELLAGSGYGRLTVQFRDSLLATDNLVPDVRVALSSLIKNDTALIRRVSYLWLGDDAMEAVRSAYPVAKDDYMEGILEKFEATTGITISGLRRFGEWFRRKSALIEVDGMRCKEVSERKTADILRSIVLGCNAAPTLVDVEETEHFIKHMVGQLNLRAFFIALVQCNALMRCVVEEINGLLPTDVKSIEDDYALAEVLFERLWTDSLTIAKNGIWGNFNDYHRGIKRVFGGNL